MAELTPREIVRELDRYIVGQDEAKRSVAIACATATAAPRWRSPCGKKSVPRTF